MPEASQKTIVSDITGHTKRLRSLLFQSPSTIENLCRELKLTKPQVLTLLQPLEEGKEVYYSRHFWHLRER